MPRIPLWAGYAADTGDIKKTQLSMTSQPVHEQLYKKCLRSIRSYVEKRMPAPTESKEPKGT